MTMLHPLGPHNRVRFTNVEPDTDVQPNAIDLRIDKVFVPQQGVFILSEEKKVHRGSRELLPKRFQDEDGWWGLMPGFYEIVFKNEIKLPKGEAGFVIPRSTLVRNGVYLSTGLYDSGYEGMMVSGLHVTTGVFYVKKGTRIAQFLLFEAETLRKYDGAYGSRKQHDNEKYEILKKEGWVDGRTKTKINNEEDEENTDDVQVETLNKALTIEDELKDIKNVL